MSFSDFIASDGRKVRKDHFLHLVQIAEIDGKLTDIELEVLHREGKKFGLTDPEIDHIIDKQKDFHYLPPYSLQDKFDELYNIALVVLADNEVSERERQILRRYAISAGFEDNIIDSLVTHVLEGVQNKTDEDDLFDSFRKKFRR
jgi:uncharacterized tellurite resistance protein B-like protein